MTYGGSPDHLQAPQARQCKAYISRHWRNISKVGELPMMSTVKGGFRANSRKGPIPLRSHQSAPFRSRDTQECMRKVAISGVNFDIGINAPHHLALVISRLFGGFSIASPKIAYFLRTSNGFGLTGATP